MFVCPTHVPTQTEPQVSVGAASAPSAAPSAATAPRGLPTSTSRRLQRCASSRRCGSGQGGLFACHVHALTGQMAWGGPSGTARVSCATTQPESCLHPRAILPARCSRGSSKHKTHIAAYRLLLLPPPQRHYAPHGHPCSRYGLLLHAHASPAPPPQRHPAPRPHPRAILQERRGRQRHDGRTVGGGHRGRLASHRCAPGLGCGWL
jgi:hypothetical protein